MAQPFGEHDVVVAARRIADELLFPRALATDRAEVLPVDLLEVLARAGLYGVAGPCPVGGGRPVDEVTRMAVLEALAGGCLTTAFVWAQHHNAVAAVATAAPPELRAEWLEPLCTGRRRAGVAFAGLRRAGPPVLTVNQDESSGDWVLQGSAPWVTGWGLVDVVHVAARDADGDVVWLLMDAKAAPSLGVQPLSLAAVSASATVTLRFEDHRVPAHRCTLEESDKSWRKRDSTSLRMNGALALGVAGRCARLLGPGLIDEELATCRRDLIDADVTGLPVARAHTADVALRAAAALVAVSGGRAMLTDHHAQRLAREAMFLLVFGQTQPIRTALLPRLATPR